MPNLTKHCKQGKAFKLILTLDFKFLFNFKDADAFTKKRQKNQNKHNKKFFVNYIKKTIWVKLYKVRKNLLLR